MSITPPNSEMESNANLEISNSAVLDWLSAMKAEMKFLEIEILKHNNHSQGISNCVLCCFAATKVAMEFLEIEILKHCNDCQSEEEKKEV
ncbi:unnamed protein product [Trifolium pratense]|uniref:Uncharacterized protein n=1 Tax=Trifolium pratense TaxID=57577 RepID=A0ACB0JGL5_TRIPR|nr:unnamed protein product [Trifolium pratense]